MVAHEDLYEVETDIFAPCGCGGVINTETIPRLRCAAIAGAANNQLTDPERDERLLSERGILYCPDVVVNGGGLINVGSEFPRYDRKRAEKLTGRIPDILEDVLRFAELHRISSEAAVCAIAERRIREARAVRA